MSDQTNPQREIDRRPIRRLEIRPLGEGASADQERFETVLTDPTSQSAGEPALHAPAPLDREETESPGAGRVRPRAAHDRFTTTLAVLLLLGVSLLGLVLVRSAGLPPGQEAVETAVSGSAPAPLAPAAYSVAPLPVYPVPGTSSASSSVSPIPMARQRQAPRPDPAPARTDSVVQTPSSVLFEESSAQAPADDKPVPAGEIEQETPPAVEAFSADSEAQASQPQAAAPAPRQVQPGQPVRLAPGHSASAAARPGRPDVVMSALQEAKPSTASKPPARQVSLPPRPTLRPLPPDSQVPRQVASATGLNVPLPWTVQAPAPSQAAEKRSGTSEAPRSLATYLANPWLLLPPLRGEH